MSAAWPAAWNVRGRIGPAGSASRAAAGVFVSASYVVVGVALLCALAGPAVATPDRSRHEALVRRALSPHLETAAIERLLANPEVAAALDELLEGWDGRGDALDISHVGGRLVLAVQIRERRCALRLDAGPEAPKPEPHCEDVTRPDGHRRLDLDPRLWKAPRPKPRPRPKTEPSAPEGPAEQEPWGEAPVAPPTVLRQGDPERLPFGSEVVNEARVAHERLREVVARPGYHDPLLPKTGVAPAAEVGVALAPMLAEPVEKASASLTHLRNPFGDGRMRTDVPVAGPAFGNDAPPVLPRLTEECETSWRLRERSEKPPELACYRSYAWHARLDDDEVFKTLEALTMFFDIPLAKFVMAKIAEGVKTSRAHEVVWAMVWLDWVGRAPDDDKRMSTALAALSVGERRYLRKHLAALWSRPGFMTVRSDLAAGGPKDTPAAALVTRLYERHLLELYPEAKDLDGLPRRAFVTDTWLWANNWLTILDGRPEDAIAQAYHRLGEAERKVIDAFVGEPLIARRFSRAPQVIARL